MPAGFERGSDIPGEQARALGVHVIGVDEQLGGIDAGRVAPGIDDDSPLPLDPVPPVPDVSNSSRRFFNSRISRVLSLSPQER